MTKIHKFLFLIHMKPVNIPGPKALLQPLEAAAFGREEVAGRQTAWLQLRLGMSRAAPAGLGFNGTSHEEWQPVTTLFGVLRHGNGTFV